MNLIGINEQRLLCGCNTQNGLQWPVHFIFGQCQGVFFHENLRTFWINSVNSSINRTWFHINNPFLRLCLISSFKKFQLKSSYYFTNPFKWKLENSEITLSTWFEFLEKKKSIIRLSHKSKNNIARSITSMNSLRKLQKQQDRMVQIRELVIFRNL